MENNEIYLSKTINQLREVATEALMPVLEALNSIVKRISSIFTDTWNQLNLGFKKQISRKRFIKLLMSQGIQRNTATKIAIKIHNIKGKYTLWDYVLVIKNKEEYKC